MIPQAFTTRDMSEAYKWLMTLPPQVREDLKSMEQAVSLYLRAKRSGSVLPTKEDVLFPKQISNNLIFLPSSFLLKWTRRIEFLD